jgi:ribosome-binding factor A
VSTRTVRINELMQREISDILRRHFQTEAVAVTVTEVRVAPDLRDARVFVSIVGEDEQIAEKLRWLRRQAPFIREELARRIVLKYLPRMQYVLDETTVASNRVLKILDELGGSAEKPTP